MGGPSKTDKGPLLNEWAWMGIAFLSIVIASSAMIAGIFALVG